MDEDKDYLLMLSKALEKAERQRLRVDNPEGSQFVIFSDTLVDEISSKLKEIAGRL